MFKQAISKKSFRIATALAFSVIAVIMFMLLSGTKAEAKTIVIKTPSQMRNINWKNKGFGPGNIYKLGTGMELTKDNPNGDNGTVLLTKGKFVIDLNGHTLQSTDSRCAVISIRGANVIIKDSKAKTAKRSRPSVRSYGMGAVEITKGSLTIKNGYYCGASNGQNNPMGLHVGGGTCTVQGGVFDGDHVGASVAGGKLRINGGTFKTSYMFGLMRFGAGKISITKGTFKNTKSGSFNPTFALGAYTNNGKTYNFSNWLASGSHFSPTMMAVYWNGTSNDVSQYPSKVVGTSYVQTVQNYLYAASYTGNSIYQASTIKVTSKAAPKGTTIKSLSPRSKGLAVKWKKQTKKTTGYQLQYSTSSKFKKAKVVTVKGKKQASKLISKLRGGTKYYVRIRTYRALNGTKFYSKWSKAKSAKANN